MLLVKSKERLAIHEVAIAPDRMVDATLDPITRETERVGFWFLKHVSEAGTFRSASFSGNWRRLRVNVEFMDELRKKPYLHATWMAKVISDSFHCNWSVWYRTHFQFEKIESDFTIANAKHGELRRCVESDLISAGWSPQHEVEWKIEGKRMDFAGRCDIVAVRPSEGRGLICEIKSGRPYETDKIQLLIYMWALRKGNARFREVLFDGRIYYSDRIVDVPALECDEAFAEILKRYTVEILENEPPMRHPSYFGCKFCNIVKCDERQSEPTENTKTDYEPDFF